MLKYSSIRQLHERNGNDEFSCVKKCEEVAGYRRTEAGTVFVREISTIVVDKKKIPNRKCCPEYSITVSCILCGIFTKFIVKDPGRNVGREIVESVRHLHKHESPLILSDGQGYQVLMTDAGSVKKFGGMSILCRFCNKKICEVDELIVATKDYKHQALGIILRELCYSYSSHLSNTECIKNLDSHRANIEEFIDKINEVLAANNNIFADDDYILPEYVGMIIESKRCDCGRKFVTTCKICGASRKDWRGYISSYELCAKRHLTKTPKMDIRDVLTPINPQIVGACVCVTEKDVEDNYRHVESNDNCKYFMKCDGYMCAICGVEYADTSKKIPPRAIVLGHLKKCIEENKESIRRYGQYCV